MPRLIKALATPPEEWFGAALDAALINGEMDNPRLDPGWHHPSGISDNCDRFLQFSFIGVAPTNPPSAALVFMGKVGSFIHVLVQDLLETHPRISAIEGGLEDPVTRVRGSNDMAILDFDDIDAILDIKSCIELPDEPKSDHMLQGAWYCYLSGRARFVIQYIKRSNGGKRRFTVPWNQLRPIWEASLNRLNRITQQTVDGELAPMTPARRADCLSCRVKNFCDAAENGSDEWLALRQETIRIIGSSPV